MAKIVKKALVVRQANGQEVIIEPDTILTNAIKGTLVEVGIVEDTATGQEITAEPEANVSVAFKLAPTKFEDSITSVSMTFNKIILTSVATSQAITSNKDNIKISINGNMETPKATKVGQNIELQRMDNGKVVPFTDIQTLGYALGSGQPTIPINNTLEQDIFYNEYLANGKVLDDNKRRVVFDTDSKLTAHKDDLIVLNATINGTPALSGVTLSITGGKAYVNLTKNVKHNDTVMIKLDGIHEHQMLNEVQEITDKWQEIRGVKIEEDKALLIDGEVAHTFDDWVALADNGKSKVQVREKGTTTLLALETIDGWNDNEDMKCTFTDSVKNNLTPDKSYEVSLDSGTNWHDIVNDLPPAQTPPDYITDYCDTQMVGLREQGSDRRLMFAKKDTNTKTVTETVEIMNGNVTVEYRDDMNTLHTENLPMADVDDIICGELSPSWSYDKTKPIRVTGNGGDTWYVVMVM